MLRRVTVVLLIGVATAATAKASSTPFAKLQREASSESTTVTEPSSPSDASTSADDTPPDSGHTLFDAWKDDNVLATAKRIMNGDHFGALMDLTANKDLIELWTTPTVLHQLLNTMPMFKSIKPLEAIANKDVADVTPNDGLKALQVFQDFLKISADQLQAVASPRAFAEKFQEYANTDEPAMKKLMKLASNGDRDAVLTLQQAIVDKEFDGMIDLKKFGFGGEATPEPITQMRDVVLNDTEFDLWDLATGGDPEIDRYLRDPLQAAKDDLAAIGGAKWS